MCCCAQLMTVVPQVSLQWWGKILRKEIITKVIKQEDREEPGCCMAGVSRAGCCRAGLRCSAADGADVLCDAGVSSCPPLQSLWIVMSKARVLLEVSSFLVAANKGTARQQETCLLRLQTESNFVHKEKQLV